MDLRPRERSKLRMIFRGLFGGYSAMFHDRPLGCGRAVVNFIVFVAVLTGLWYVGQAVFYPWGRSLTPRPMLTGQWLGATTDASGRRMLLYLDMKIPFWGECQGHYNCDFDGRAALCSLEHGVHEYT